MPARELLYVGVCGMSRVVGETICSRRSVGVKLVSRFLLFDICASEEILANVLKAVTKPLKQLVLTFALIGICIFQFGLFAFTRFGADFLAFKEGVYGLPASRASACAPRMVDPCPAVRS